MDKYDRALADYKRRKRQKRILAKLCLLWMLLGFVLGVAFCMAMVNLFA